MMCLSLMGLLPISGCSTHPVPKAEVFDASMTDLNQGYALLYTLVGKNEKVDQIFILKNATPATKAVVQDIAKLCRETQEQLDAFAKQDPKLGMSNHGLPKFEVKTREAIESTTTRKLLGSSGDLFEKRLLQTQAQSTNYLSHLALALSANDDNAQRKTFLKKVSQQADKLHDQAMNRLTVNKVSDQQGAHDDDKGS
jgi:hypothetical protein